MNAGTVTVDVNMNIVLTAITPHDFATWLKGVLDATGGTLTPEQCKLVSEKLALVSPYAGWTFFQPNPCAQPWIPNDQPWYHVTCETRNP